MSRIQPPWQHLPNLLTLCNLAIGFLAVLMALDNQLLSASWLILLAALFDFLDGFAAKLLGAASEFGKQLDSLADIISFGVAPASLVFMLMKFTGVSGSDLGGRLILYSPMLLVLFAAIRLAAFNIREATQGFMGLATPAAAIFLAGLCIGVVSHPQARFTDLLLRPSWLLGIILTIGILMILPVPMFSLKFKRYGWKGNEIRYLFLAVSLILLIILQEIAWPVIILVYGLFSIASLLSKTSNR
jgi:CDP-diacylglycerol--serine O-phosphatidyltransferase